jgi:hypothetical protein
VVTSAPTFPQVRAILWREINRACEDYSLRRDRPMAQVEWRIDGQLVAFGRKPSDYTPTAFQGIHARYVLIVLDEACGIPLNLWEAADTLITGSECRILAIGNPDDPATEFFNVCQPNSGWNTIKISAYDSPNFTEEEIPERMQDLIVSKVWVDEKVNKWKRVNHPYWYSKVLGEFPTSSPDALITMPWIRNAQQFYDDWQEGKRTVELEPHILGVDVARFGGDLTTICERKGAINNIIATYGVQDTMTTTGYVVKALHDSNATSVAVDGVGVGGGVVDRLSELGEPVRDMQAGKAARDKTTYLRQRSEWFWTLREKFENGDIAIDPTDEELASQLLSIKWKPDSTGKIKIESKEDMKDRGLSSPDRADALALANAEFIIDFDSLYDVHECYNCGHRFYLPAEWEKRACPRCGRINVIGARQAPDGQQSHVIPSVEELKSLVPKPDDTEEDVDARGNSDLPGPG